MILQPVLNLLETMFWKELKSTLIFGVAIMNARNSILIEWSTRRGMAMARVSFRPLVALRVYGIS